MDSAATNPHLHMEWPPPIGVRRSWFPDDERQYAIGGARTSKRYVEGVSPGSYCFLGLSRVLPSFDPGFTR